MVYGTTRPCQAVESKDRCRSKRLTRNERLEGIPFAREADLIRKGEIQVEKKTRARKVATKFLCKAIRYLLEVRKVAHGAPFWPCLRSQVLGQRQNLRSRSPFWAEPTLSQKTITTRAGKAQDSHKVAKVPLRGPDRQNHAKLRSQTYLLDPGVTLLPRRNCNLNFKFNFKLNFNFHFNFNLT